MKSILIIGKKSFIGSNLKNYLKKFYRVDCLTFEDVIKKDILFFENFSHVINTSIHKNYINERYRLINDLDRKFILKFKKINFIYIFLNTRKIYLPNSNINENSIKKPSCFYSKNKLKTIPKWVDSFQLLTKIDLYKNDFEHFPKQILTLTQLDTLIISRNKLDSLPHQIKLLEKLQYLDLWDNLILYYPESISTLKNLKTLDIRGVTYGPTLIEKLTSTLPWATILYDEPCSCVE